MGFQLSPGVNVSEIDLTTSIPAVATSIGAIAGPAAWGPVFEPTLLSSEDKMVSIFGKPNTDTANTFFTASSFLAYTNSLWFTRIINEEAATGSGQRLNRSWNANTGPTNVLVKNEADFKEKMEMDEFVVQDKDAVNRHRTMFIAKYPGSLGNSIAVAFMDAGLPPTTTYIGGRIRATLSNMTRQTTADVITGITGSGIKELAAIRLNGFSLDGKGFTSGANYAFASVSYSLVTTIEKMRQLYVGVVKGSTALTSAFDSIFDGNAAIAQLYSDAGITRLTSASAVMEQVIASMADAASVLAYNTTNAADIAAGTLTAQVQTVFVYNADGSIFDLTIDHQVIVPIATTTANPKDFMPTDLSTLVLGSGAVAINDLLVIQNGAITVTIGSHGISGNNDLYSYQDAQAATPNEDALKATFKMAMLVINTDNTNARMVPSAQLDFLAGITTDNIFSATKVDGDGFYYKGGTNPATGIKQDPWAYASLFELAPTTTQRAEAVGAKNDEMHIVVIDSKGLWTGVKGSVLEKFAFVSKSTDGKTEDGTNNYYVDVINRNSSYIWATGTVEPLFQDLAADGTVSATNLWLSNPTAHNWGGKFTDAQGNGVEFARLKKPFYMDMVGGTDAYESIGVDDYINGYDFYASGEKIDINLVMFGNTMNMSNDILISQYIIDNVVNSRRDCMATLSPARETCVGNFIGKEEKVVQYFRGIAGESGIGIERSTSYASADCNWKQMYDKYNDIIRWVPLSGDIAGLCAFTDKERDAWWSPAGFNRGKLKNVVKLAWNPDKAQRDYLYQNGINPVLSFPGEGPVLYGDKTLLTKPSAFDRINVRRLFIVCEKAIATASKYSLFEFNDAFTRLQFVNMVTPFLREVQGRRGIYDFKVVCNESNNTPEVVDSNQFVGDIYIKPARSINYIQLNFVAVKTGVDFAEVIGKF